MIKMTRSKIFFFASIVISVAAFWAFLNANRVFSSEMEIILIPRNDITAKGIDQITTDAQNLPQTLSFYDEMVKNGNISDPKKGLPDIERKSYWNWAIKTEKTDNSSIIKITAFDPGRVQAETLDRQAVATLIGRLSQYYNIKTELDIRIIENPVVAPALGKNPFLLALYGLLVGMISGLLTAFIFSIIPAPDQSGERLSRLAFTLANLPKLTKPKKEGIKIEENPVTFDKRPEAIIPQKNKEEIGAIIAPPPVVFSPFQKKSSAPVNLPIADEKTALDIEKKIYSNGKKEEDKDPAPKEQKKDIFREATPEEVKERLNKLLSGKL